MRSVADAQAHVMAAVAPLPADRIALADARGRVLAGPAAAGRALPGFVTSAMDGFAVRAADVPARLPVTGGIAAGRLDPPALAPGTAVRIMTGAPLPAGADTVVMFEDAETDGDHVQLPAARAGDNVRIIGEDIALGAAVLAAGTRLGAGELAVLAALGHAELEVARMPRVAIISTGDELVEVATAPRSGQLVDSSAYMLGAQVRDAGGEPVYLGIGRDDRVALGRMIERGLDADAVITTGGVSAGDHDHVRAALADAGVDLELWKVAMKPGKPFAFGRASADAHVGHRGHAGTPVFALPGNPVSSWVAFELFVRPALLAMQGAAVRARPRAPVELRDRYTKQAGRAHYLRAALHRDGPRLIATLHPKQGSAMLCSLIGVDALVEIPADATEVAAGATAWALLLEAA